MTAAVVETASIDGAALETTVPHPSGAPALASVRQRSLAAVPALAGQPRLVGVPDCEPPLGNMSESVAPAIPRPRPPRESVVVPSERVAPAVTHRRWAPSPRGDLPRQVSRDVSPGLRPRRRAVITITAPERWSDPGEGDLLTTSVPVTAVAELPPAFETGTMLARALLEMLCGRRDFEQLRPYCARKVFVELQELPMLGGNGNALLMSTTVCEPAVGVAEVSAVFQCAKHVRAMALRLESSDGRWCLAALHMG